MDIFKHIVPRDDQGSMTTELALVLPVFLMMLVGIIETGMLLFTNSALENAILRSSRFGVLGAEGDNGVSRTDKILAIIEEQTFGRVNMNSLEMQTLVYDSFADINQEEPYEDSDGSGDYTVGENYSDINGNGQWDADMGVAGPGGAGDIVLYKVSYHFQTLTSFLDPLFKNINLTATVAVRNEPY